jgi:GNAT superfamily N-acetyltransferase
MSPISFRTLNPDDVLKFATIDRSEVIDGRYRVVEGELVCDPHHHVVTGWYPSEIPDHINGIQRAITNGGAAFGAWHEGSLVGITALVVDGVGGDPTVLQLEPLQVSAPWRKQGIGKRLTSMVAGAARARRARFVYISSIPTRNTVDAYLRMGARLASPPDPELFAREPEDIHLVLPL